MLTKLNISRTAVCDRGVCRLRLPSLIMLNVNWTCVTEQSSLERLRESGEAVRVWGCECEAVRVWGQECEGVRVF